MNKITQQELLDAGVHFGHLKRKWNPKMLPFIFMERKGIHIIDLNKTIEGLEDAGNSMKAMAKSGKKILFVATKKQAKDIVAQCAIRTGMPFATERWLGGMLTNFSTIRKSVKKMQSIEKMLADGTLENITKKEKLMMSRDKDKMEKVIGGIANMNRLPSAIFLVDIGHEHIALAEAKKLNITTFAMVDTNCDPNTVDYAIPANDDATKSITAITTYLMNCVLEGLEERKNEKVEETEETAEETAANLAAEGADADADGADRKRRRGTAAGSSTDKNMRKPAHKVGGDRKPR
jgi:small subunit ribosomal protein S2